jgi:hypothetical protein
VEGGSAAGIEDRLRQIERGQEVLEEQVRELRQALSGSGGTPAAPGSERPSAGTPADPGGAGSSGEAVKPPPLAP